MNPGKPRSDADLPEADLPPEDDSTEDLIIEPVAEIASFEWNAGEKIEGKAGIEIIQELVKRLPNGPGVYRMMNNAGDVLYVGKARSLKKRVTSYAQGRGHSNRIHRMVADTASMEFVTTRTEAEALLLEANLIKRLRPRYNVLLRDDKSFPYILISGDHASPGIFKHRGAQNRKGSYFGPFASAGAVARTINALQRAFLIRTCTDSFLENRTRPCLLYQIKRCAGPCTHEVTPSEYDEMVQEAKDFLSGRSQKVKTTLSTAMNEAAETLDFERAAIYRDRLSALSHVTSSQGINPQTIDEADVFAIAQDGAMTCIEVFFFRTGQNWGNHAYFPRADPSLSKAEVLGSFLAQFYDGKPIPKSILLSDKVDDQELLELAFSEHAGRKIEISVPQRGEKKSIIEQVAANGREALARKLADTASQKMLLEGIAKVFNLPAPPRRIEVYDNSHIMGANAVGAMIVAGPEGFVKNQYRKFNIRSTTITPGDDFGMMKEVMGRRFSRLIKENTDVDGGPAPVADDEAFPAWPDLVLIDGGQGQMTAVRGMLKELGLDGKVTAIGIAKGVDRDAGRERFFAEGRDAFSMPPRDPVLYFIQRLRDEAHRFAIGSHRARRKKELIKNPLDEIDGIGPTRKRALLNHFGTAKAVSRAGIDDLKAVDGVSAAMAEAIYNHFHENR
ncbi:MAG: excinuclease ABC subunit UvrC [Rhizobiaceae bacterium]